MASKDGLKKWQVFTPNEIVKKILTTVHYNNYQILDRRILENSCGEGHFLEEIVKRYIFYGLKNNMEIEGIKRGLETYIYGYEIDPVCYNKCIKNLNCIVEEYNMTNVNWKIYNKDFLKAYCNGDIKLQFDFIVGNPPYINYTELSVDTREFVKDKFSTCKKGKFDYCYAFIEAALELLSPNGRFSYIVPNSVFKNVYAENLRELMLPYISKILDYSDTNVFEKALTSTVIFLCQNGKTIKDINYKNKSNRETLQIEKTGLKSKWQFKNENNNLGKNKKFGDYFKASIGVATLYNKAFLINAEELKDKDDYFQLNCFKIEKDALRLTASPRSKTYDKKQYIIYPYINDNGQIIRFADVKDFRKSFPRTAEYLQIYKNQLLKRNADNSAQWFEYGRSQALRNLQQKKLLVSTIITNKVSVYELSENTIPYSGIYIVALNDNDLAYAKRILESQDFFNYVQEIGISANGKSKRITVKDINNFIF